MAVPKTNVSPPFNIVRTSHAELGVTDLDYARDFYINLLGYVCEDDFDNTLYLRGMEEQNHHSLILTQAEAPIVYRIAFKVASDMDLERAAIFYNSNGCQTDFVDRHAQDLSLIHI